MTPFPVIDILPEQKEKMSRKDYGGSMAPRCLPVLLKARHHRPRVLRRGAHLRTAPAPLRGQC